MNERLLYPACLRDSLLYVKSAVPKYQHVHVPFLLECLSCGFACGCDSEEADKDRKFQRTEEGERQSQTGSFQFTSSWLRG